MVVAEGFLRHEASRRDVRSILLVDDDAGLCKLMAEFFSSHDFRLEAVHDSMIGLSKALEGVYDLIILDIMLPILDGLVLKSSGRRTHAHHSVNSAHHTAGSHRGARRRCRRLHPEAICAP